MISSIVLLVDRDARVALLDDRVDRLLDGGPLAQRDHGDARDHDLVDALVAELDDRMDHLLLLGLEDPLLAALLDDQPQLLGADPFVGGHVGPEQPADPPGRPGQERHERAEDDAEDVDEPARREHDPLGVGQADLLGHELAEDDREDRQEARDDDERDQVRRTGQRPERGQPGGHAVDEADRGEGRREEARGS